MSLIKSRTGSKKTMKKMNSFKNLRVQTGRKRGYKFNYDKIKNNNNNKGDTNEYKFKRIQRNDD